MYFILLACLTLLLGIISCSNDNFGNDLSEDSKQLSKAELIEQALSRMPKTRGENPNAVVMVTIQNSVQLQCLVTDDMTIYYYNDGNEESMEVKQNIKEYNLVFTDSFPSHKITIVGSEDALRSLTVNNGGLISLNVSGNKNLVDLRCKGNHLDAIDLTACSSLGTLDISNNEFSILDVKGLPLYFFYAENNQLTELDVSQNLNLSDLLLGNNQLTELNVSKNQYLSTLGIENNQLTSLDLSNNPDVIVLKASFNPITDLNLGKNESLMYLYLEHLPLRVFNNNPISDTSFAIYSQLMELNVAYTPFESLNLSYNPILLWVDISGSTIAQLNISDMIINGLYATRSKLTDLIYEKKDLRNLSELRIERTPFEDEQTNIENLSKDLPPKTVEMPGHLYTYSSHINMYYLDLKRINWLINQ